MAIFVMSAVSAFLSAPDGQAAHVSRPAKSTTIASDPKIARALKRTRILVVGSTGRNGSAIVEALEAAGATPRAMVRDLAKAKEKAGPGVQRDWVVADLRDPVSLDAALKGVQVVINAAATTQLQGDNDTAAVDREGTRNLVGAAKRAGVKRIVFITGMSVYSPPPNMPPPFLKAFGDKREAEKILAASGIEYVTLRPTGILARPAGAWKIRLAASSTYKAKAEELVMRTAESLPPPDAPPPPGTIARADLAEVAIVSAVEPRARNRAFIVTQTSEPRGRSDWRDQLAKMPGD
ncbi:MAG: SDR family oxidoreductase [Steroidobacteraceae bacterium]